MRMFVRATTVVFGLTATSVGVWAVGWPHRFSDAVGFTPHRHFVHDVGAFQLGIGVALLLATIWADAIAVNLAGYVAASAVHTAAHVMDADLGGSAPQTWAIGLSGALAVAALAMRWRELGWVLGTVSPPATAVWAPLARQKTVALTTYRRDGTPVTTAVSIAVDGDRAYVRTFERAGKNRRIRRDPSVHVAPSNALGAPTGPGLEATARRLSGTEQRRAGRALARKYPMLQGVLVPLTHRLGRARTGRTVHFELVPRSPDGAAPENRGRGDVIPRQAGAPVPPSPAR